MAVLRSEFNRIPYLGAFAVATDALLMVPDNFGKIPEKNFSKALGVSVVRVSICQSPLIGVFVAGNQHGVIVPDLFGVDEEEFQERIEIKTVRIPGKYTALGNQVLANDNGALINPDIPDEAVDIISKTLDVPARRGTIAGLKSVGSAGVTTNRGALLHSNIEESELEIAEEILGVPIDIGTASRGIKNVGICVVANSKGALVGTNTTGPELGRIESSLGFV